MGSCLGTGDCRPGRRGSRGWSAGSREEGAKEQGDRSHGVLCNQHVDDGGQSGLGIQLASPGPGGDDTQADFPQDSPGSWLAPPRQASFVGSHSLLAHPPPRAGLNLQGENF